MLTVNIHEAKTHVSRLLDRAAKAEPFHHRKPLTRAAATGNAGRRSASPARVHGRAGRVPDDFDRIGEAEIEQLFGSDLQLVV